MEHCKKLFNSKNNVFEYESMSLKIDVRYIDKMEIDSSDATGPLVSNIIIQLELGARNSTTKTFIKQDIFSTIHGIENKFDEYVSLLGDALAKDLSASKWRIDHINRNLKEVALLFRG